MMKHFLSKKFIVLSVALFFFCPNPLFSQHVIFDTTYALRPQTDLVEAVKSLFVKKKKEQPDSTQSKPASKAFVILPYPGYALVTGFQAVLTSNFSFYADRHRTEDSKISSILMNNLYTEYNQIINVVNSNIWTNGGRYNFIGDYRFYIFPTNTFGLGSNSLPSEKQHISFSYLKIYEVITRRVADNTSLGAGYDLDYRWNITADKISSTVITDMEHYGYGSRSVSSGITLNAQYDSRLNSNNPNKGTYAFLELRNNFRFMGSNSDWQSVLFDLRKYFCLSKKTGNVLGLWSYNWFTVHGPVPFLDLPSLGWDHYNNMGRGYVQGRYRAWNMMYAEAEYRFRVTKNGLLGGVVFTSASTFTEYPNNKFENINPGGGVGIRIKMSKDSNTNLAIDYGVGVNGSRGFSFNLNEVF